MKTQKFTINELKVLIRNIVKEERNKWELLTTSDIEDNDENIFNLINTAYSDIGGHPNFKSKSDLKTGGDDYAAADLDDDPDLDAVVTNKNKAAGKKFVAMGHDGSRLAKSEAIKYATTMLKKNGYYLETNKKIADFLMNQGVPIVDDKETVEKVLKGKNIKWNGDGSYEREIGGEMRTKIMLGNPKV